ncbi:hypothetical protein L6E12_20970 [Actinokineospora sp. PR83]|uniref:hypothetical protein n=1 Tax=Actinokineospora sp. PR83 TaxID=2884908 RepID=UPI001F20798F|nr:hypothetical protein [Actinokineospora sp. PR83]MCG8918259.1 hypothetical protein [Actinokineospora sp. PR83]
MDIDPSRPAPPTLSAGDEPFTLDEVRGHVDDLLRQFADHPGVDLLGVVAAMLAETVCTCQPADTGHRALVIHLPRTR